MVSNSTPHNNTGKNSKVGLEVEASKADQAIDVRMVEGADSIGTFGESWDDLFSRAVGAPPFLSRPWISTFIEEGRINGSPVFLLAWRGTKLVALLALAVRKKLKARIAMPISTGIGFYLGLLLDPGYREAVDSMADLIVSGKVFDVFYSSELSSEDEATNDLLHKLVEKGWFCRKVFRNPCYEAKLGCSFDEYFKKKASSKSRQNLRRRERRLYEKWDVKIVQYEDEAVTPEVMQRIGTIEQKSWLKRRGAAVLNKPFYQKLLQRTAQAGLGTIWLMTINGDDAAFEYVFITHGKLQFGWRAFDLKYTSSMSIGQILMMHVIRDACEKGISSLDIGHGQSDYKDFWAETSFKVDRIAAGRGLVGRVIAFRYYIVLWLGANKWLHTAYRRVRSTIRRTRQKASTD
jgi:CelD/BcsL family acetyltransferase involved in cellulose biosynthesis